VTNYIWVIEQGCYSDYRVVGVFTSKENADIMADAINASDDTYDKATVAEWPLDPAVDELRQGYQPYIVHMRADGTTERLQKWSVSAYQLGGSVEIWRRTQEPAYQGKGIPDLIIATVWAEDEDHAVKIVNEHRARLMASGEFK